MSNFIKLEADTNQVNKKVIATPNPNDKEKPPSIKDSFFVHNNGLVKKDIINNVIIHRIISKIPVSFVNNNKTLDNSNNVIVAIFHLFNGIFLFFGFSFILDIFSPIFYFFILYHYFNNLEILKFYYIINKKGNCKNGKIYKSR